jgi:uncharacterized protein (TIGR00369 family)
VPSWSLALLITDAELRRILSDSPFIQPYGLQLHSAGDGECTLLVPFQKSFERPGGVVNGPVFMAAADIAMWFAILTKLGPSDGSVTAEMKTNFLNGAREEDVLCRAQILKLGRRLIYGVADCTNRKGKLLTHHTLTYIRP